MSLAGRGRLSLLGGYNQNSPAAVIWYSEFYDGNVAWSQQALLTPSPITQSSLALSAAGQASFGKAVAFDGETALLGEPGNGDKGVSGAGAAYFFTGELASWTQQQKVYASDPHTTAAFGSAVGFSGLKAIIGAQLDDDKGSQAGSAYSFNYVTRYVPASSRRLLPDSPVDPKNVAAPIRPEPKEKPVPMVPIQFWSQQQKLVARAPLAGDQFGAAIVVREDIALIGAPQSGTSLFGSIYIFASNDQSLWSQQQVISATIGSIANPDSFDIYGNTLVIGNSVYPAPTSTPTTPFREGAVLVYKTVGTTGANRYKFTSVTTLYPSIGSDFGFFGANVAIYGSTIFTSDLTPGNIFVNEFVGKAWTQLQILKDPQNGINPTVRSVQGGVAVFSDGNGPSAFFYTAEESWNCLILTLGDQFGD
eukprot:gene5579-7121_t